MFTVYLYAALLSKVLDHSPCLGSIFIGTSTVFITYMVLNLFISVILMAFSYEREHHKVACSGALQKINNYNY